MRFVHLVGAVGLAAVVGCGSGEPQPVRLSGTVMFAGQPVPAGNVYIEPDGSKGTHGLSGFAPIRAGAFDTAVPGGRGVRPGAYRLRVIGFTGVPTAEAPRGTGLFPEHEEAVEVSDGGAELTIRVPGK